LLLTQATLVKANAVAETLLTVAPKNIQDTYVQKEIISGGLIPANDYGVKLEVIAGLPYDTQDGYVTLEIIAQTTLTPAKPMTTITWFTPS
ncbi:hypothetical protein, partial [Enterococcus faecalis]|uniref:hypothetical protein n=1 Tax=Enterococcus faecalis TaxID=1351 RepID=UPI0025B0933F